MVVSMSYTERRTALAGLLLTLLLVSASPAGLWAQQPDNAARPRDKAQSRDADAFGLPEQTDVRAGVVDRHALIALPLATLLGAALAVRPRRRGTPPRSLPVIQTQIILSIIGAVVMIIVGSSLARAFGIVGAAGLVRYRAKIEDPKDAGVMLCTLAVGLACGVGVYGLAIFTTIFVVAVLWVVESFEPKARKTFTLEVKAKDAAKVQPKVEALLRRHRIRYELREVKPDEFQYHVQLPMDAKTDSLSAEIIALDPSEGTGVEWKPEKTKGA
jgi:uncharacterized membrane protein YhiD involved in acid resistance